AILKRRDTVAVWCLLRSADRAGMRVSVVIPTYNGERFLSQTIESVLAQTISDWELIIVDDESLDSSLAIARAYANRDARIRVACQANAGVGAARNRGLAEVNAV